jgi:hypothetical protein
MLCDLSSKPQQLVLAVLVHLLPIMATCIHCTEHVCELDGYNSSFHFILRSCKRTSKCSGSPPLNWFRDGFLMRKFLLCCHLHLDQVICATYMPC